MSPDADTLVVALTFAGYLALVLGIGGYAYRATASLSDFLLGGRRLGSGVAALSASASDMSGWLLLGLPGLAYASGLESLWLAAGLLAGTWLNWRLMAARLRVFSAVYGDALTLPEYLANRFADRRGWLRGLAALFTLFFFLLYTGSGLVAGGKLFAAVFGWPYLWAVAAGALAILLYTAIGGFLAVSWTDVLQSLLMAVALILVPLIAFSQGGGADAHLARIRALDPYLLDLFTAAGGQELDPLVLVSLLAWGLGYFGQPHILARFQAIRDASAVPPARRMAVTWVALTLGGAVLTGLAGLVVLETPLTAGARETVFIVLVHQLFHPVIAGLLLAAILAAIMSTADSQLLVSSAVFTEDFYRTLIRRQAGPRELVAVGRLSVVLVAVLAFFIALDPQTLLLDLVAQAWAGFGAAFGPVLLLSLYWPGMTRRGAIAGIVTGGLTVVLWGPLEGGLFDLYEMVPGFLFSFAAIWLVSLLEAPAAAPLREPFAQAEACLRTRETARPSQ